MSKNKKERFCLYSVIKRCLWRLSWNWQRIFNWRY